MRSKLLPIFILLVGLCFALNVLAQSKEQLLEEIRQLIKQNQLEQALSQTKHALVQYPEDQSLQYYSRQLSKKLKVKRGKNAARSTKTARQDQQATTTPKDKSPPRIQDLSSARQTLPVDGSLQIRAEITDDSKLARTWVSLLDMNNPDCGEVELELLESTIYSASVPIWCVLQAEVVGYRLAALDVHGNQAVLGDKLPLQISVVRKRTKLQERLVWGIPLALLFLILVIFATLWQSRRANRRIQRALERHAMEQKLERRTPVAPLAGSDRLDPAAVKDPYHEVREKKFKRMVQRSFNVGRKQDKDDNDDE